VRLKRCVGDSALPNIDWSVPNSQFRMIGNWYGDSVEISSPSHSDVVATLAGDMKPMLFEDAARVSSGQDAQFAHELL